MANSPTPTLAVSICLWHNDCVLMVKRGQAPAKGLWSLPGGHVNFGETLIDAARRELDEETGVKAAILTFVDFSEIMPDASTSFNRHFVLGVFTGYWQSGDVRAAGDAADARWVRPDQLGDLNTTKNLEDMISRARAVLPKV